MSARARALTPPPIAQVARRETQLEGQMLRDRIKALRVKATVVMPGGTASKYPRQSTRSGAFIRIRGSAMTGVDAAAHVPLGRTA